jgi:MFS family permease
LLRDWWLVAGAIIEGLSRALYSGNNDALLYDTLANEHQEHDYHEHLGKISSMEQVAVAIGSLIGGILATYSFSLLFWLSTLPHLLKLIVSYRITEPRAQTKSEGNIFAHTKEAIALFVRNPKLRLLSITDIISESTGEVSYQFRAAFLETLWPFWAIGFLSTFVNLGAAIGFYLSGRVIRRFGAEKILLVRSIWGKISGLIAYGVPNIFSPIITITPSFLYGPGQIAKNSLMQKEFSSAQRATMSSLNSLATSLGCAVMTFVIGFVADRFTPAQALFG